MTNNGDHPEHKVVVTATFTPDTGEFLYRHSGGNLITILGLLALAMLHLFNDRMVAEWKARQGKDEQN